MFSFYLLVHYLMCIISAFILKIYSALECLKLKTDDGGNLPIHLAAMCGNESIVRMLLEKSRPFLPASVTTVEEVMKDGECRMEEWKRLNKSAARDSTSADGGKESVFQFDESQIAPAASPEAAEEAEKFKNIGNEHFKRKEFDAALEAYSAAIKNQGDKASFWSNRSACYLSMKKNELALYDAEVK